MEGNVIKKSSTEEIIVHYKSKRKRADQGSAEDKATEFATVDTE